MNNGVLIIDQDESLYSRVHGHLERRGYTVSYGHTTADLKGHPAIVIVDLSRPDALEIVAAARGNAKIFGTTRNGRIERVVQAVKAGAIDVFDRNINPQQLYQRLEAVKPVAIIETSHTGKTRPVEIKDFSADLVVGEDPRTQKAIQDLEMAARLDRWVTLVCEAPLARQLAERFHEASARSEGPFVVVSKQINGLTPSQALFGTATQPSAFERAKGGVVFVESLESLGLEGRDRLAKLLRGLEDSGAVRWPPMVVATEEEPAVDARIDRELADILGRRSIVMPRLHARRSELDQLIGNVVDGLVRATDASGANVDGQVLEALRTRTYTGGVQELLDLLKGSAGIDAEGKLVLTSKRPAEPSRAMTGWVPTGATDGEVRPYDEYEAEIFRFALERVGGCVSRAAELLQVGRATMYRKMRAYSIAVPPVSERTTRRGRRVKARAAVQ